MAKIPFPPFGSELFSELTEQVSKLLPSEQSREEIQRSVQLLVQSALSKLDLVTREEFDAQTIVLQKTREKLEKLEKIVAEISAQEKS